MVPPGNWCEIFKMVAACAVPVPNLRIAGAASADAMTCRRVIMDVSLMLFLYWECGRCRCGMLARQTTYFLSSDSLRRCRGVHLLLHCTRIGFGCLHRTNMFCPSEP